MTDRPPRERSTLRSQRVWSLSARGWTPTPGVHRGLACATCGAVADDLYRLVRIENGALVTRLYCVDHQGKEGDDGER